LNTKFNVHELVLEDEQINFIRGFFDAEGGIPSQSNYRFYIQLVQKNYEKMT
jgi:intein-encoded DNA endonuclease-like protein